VRVFNSKSACKLIFNFRFASILVRMSRNLSQRT